jgi:hypothetical protein
MGSLLPANRIPWQTRAQAKRSGRAILSESFPCWSGRRAGHALPGAVGFRRRKQISPHQEQAGRPRRAPAPRWLATRLGAHWECAAKGLGPPRVRASRRGRGARWRAGGAGKRAGRGRAGNCGGAGRDSRCLRCPPPRRDTGRGVGKPDEDRGCGRRRPGCPGPAAGPVTASALATAPSRARSVLQPARSLPGCGPPLVRLYV